MRWCKILCIKFFTAFNALRPQLLAEATNNALMTAQQFASDSGAQVGKIRSANQELSGFSAEMAAMNPPLQSHKHAIKKDAGYQHV